MSDHRKAGLDIRIEGDQLVISIGVDSLCVAATVGPYFDAIVGAANGAEPTITDFDAFAAAIVTELDREEEDGTTLVHRMLDKAAERAVEMGCEGIELPKPVTA